jgi:hypothetical protein
MAWQQDFVTRSRDLTTGSTNEFIEFRLSREAKLGVWIEGPTGLSAAGSEIVRVSLGSSSGTSGGISIGPANPGGAQIVSGEAGQSVWLAARHPALATSGYQRETFPEAGQKDVVLRLNRGARAVVRAPRSVTTGSRPSGWDLVDRRSGLSLADVIPAPRVEEATMTMTYFFDKLPPGDLLFRVGQLEARRALADGDSVEIDLQPKGEGDSTREQQP